ncbi:MAG: ribonuclease III [Deltaproteobacteria bacterium]|nr:ribonuclease III [Deltaproteobacteria bacterium]
MLFERHWAELERLEERLRYRFKDRKLLLVAVTHRSFINEHKGQGYHDNERLEFLGDAVLELVISHSIMEWFPGFPEGQLSKLRASIVNESHLAIVARVFVDLGSFLLLGKGEENTGGRQKPSILADAYEALLGALYLDGGLAPVFRIVGEHFVAKLIEAQVEGYDRDFKTQLQELSQARFDETPAYVVTLEQGPSHEKHFEVAAVISGVFYGIGRGKSKKEAEQAAAQATLKILLKGQ